MSALAALAAGEGNLTKLERLWSELFNLMPKGLDCCDNPSYDEKRFEFATILEHINHAFEVAYGFN